LNQRSSTLPTKLGIIGCGNISSTYLQTPQLFNNLEIVACADIDLARAQAQAQAFAIAKACSVDELLADPEIELVVNLTIPAAHASISQASLAAGKSVYSEKPLAITGSDGMQLLKTAQQRHLRLGCAPDTFLGGALQTCIALIDAGAIGTPIAATAFMLNHGMEHWHPDPTFFYQPGAGPLFDLGPYYLTALVTMLGPVRRTTGMSTITFPERTVTSQPNYGRTIPVTTPTHITGVLEFASGAIGTLITSFDVWHHHLPAIEIYGTKGSLSVPDPNTFDGSVSLRLADDEDWRIVPSLYNGPINRRGLGLADMVSVLHTERSHRASAELAYHVLEITETLIKPSEDGRHSILHSTCDRPKPLTLDDYTQWEKQPHGAEAK
jgi:predicted dehydrogenase